MHRWLTVAWIVVGGSVTYMLSDSVAWIAFMSLYANIVGHWSAHASERAEEAIKDKD